MVEGKPKEFRATVALVRGPSNTANAQLTGKFYDENFVYETRFFASATSARLWAAKEAKNNPDSSGSATVYRCTWEFDEIWLMTDEDCIWSI
jgi:hypothetical protein